MAEFNPGRSLYYGAQAGSAIANASESRAKQRLYDLEARQKEKEIKDQESLADAYRQNYTPASPAVPENTGETTPPTDSGTGSQREMVQDENGNMVPTGSDAVPAKPAVFNDEGFMNAASVLGVNPVKAYGFLSQLSDSKLKYHTEQMKQHSGAALQLISQYQDDLQKKGPDRALAGFRKSYADYLDAHPELNTSQMPTPEQFTPADAMNYAMKESHAYQMYNAITQDRYREQLGKAAVIKANAVKDKADATITAKNEKEMKIKDIMGPYDKLAVEDKDSYQIAAQAAEEGVDQGMSVVQIRSLIANRLQDKQNADDAKTAAAAEANKPLNRLKSLFGKSPAQATETPEVPPYPGAKKAPDGNWYIKKNGKYFKVN